MEEVLNNTITETETNGEQGLTPTPEKTETNVEKSAYTAPSEEEYKKAIQSAKSKAKFELLQELEIKNVEEFHNLKNKYNSAIESYDSLKTELDNANQRYEELEQTIKLKSLGVADEYKDYFLTLMKAQLRNPEDFDVVGEAILNRNPSWRVNAPAVKMGVEKSESKDTVKESSGVSKDIKRKYPWIK